jgi:hypothetical protein
MLSVDILLSDFLACLGLDLWQRGETLVVVVVG